MSVRICAVCVCVLYVDNSKVHSSLEPKSVPCIQPISVYFVFYSTDVGLFLNSEDHGTFCTHLFLLH